MFKFNRTVLSRRNIVACLTFSLLAHLLIFRLSTLFGNYDFVAAVHATEAVMVTLEGSLPTAQAAPEQKREKQAVAAALVEQQARQKSPMAAPPVEYEIPPGPASTSTKPVDSAAVTNMLEDTAPVLSQSDGIDRSVLPPELSAAAVTQASIASDSISGTGSAESTIAAEQLRKLFTLAPTLRKAGEFMSAQEELLNYRISLFGMPVGSAELQAKNVNGEVNISLRIKSNAALSNLYPVDNLIETRHMGGNFILTKIKQHEGNFVADTGFCISLREKSVLWVDRIKIRSVNETIPNDEVLDTLSGLYYLRNRPLQVGVTEMLHVYDSEDYAAVPVEVLRRETLRLDNLDKVETLVVRPAQKGGRLFRGTGDTLIWLTDDEKRVPVKIETRISLGKVTADLVSAESTLL